LEGVSGERGALAQEVKVLHLKLEHSEREHESTRRECDTLRDDVGHLRGLTSQQSDAIQNLTEEMKGLTIALHHEQNQRLALEAHIQDEEEEQKPKKPGFLRRAFTGKPKPKRRRKGKFARVGPS
jgi:uncharacterized coiled-coil DUF342 family protein